jgi:hypothetical protein
MARRLSIGERGQLQVVCLRRRRLKLAVQSVLNGVENAVHMLAHGPFYAPLHVSEKGFVHAFAHLAAEFLFFLPCASLDPHIRVLPKL